MARSTYTAIEAPLRRGFFVFGVAGGRGFRCGGSRKDWPAPFGAVVLPGPVSVAAVQKLFDDEGNCLDASVEKRIRGLATNLVDYIRGSICPRIALEEAVRRGEFQWMKRAAD